MTLTMEQYLFQLHRHLSPKMSCFLSGLTTQIGWFLAGLGKKLRAEGTPMEEIIEVPERASLKGRLVTHDWSRALSWT